MSDDFNQEHQAAGNFPAQTESEKDKSKDSPVQNSKDDFVMESQQ